MGSPCPGLTLKCDVENWSNHTAAGYILNSDRNHFLPSVSHERRFLHFHIHVGVCVLWWWWWGVFKLDTSHESDVFTLQSQTHQSDASIRDNSRYLSHLLMCPSLSALPLPARHIQPVECVCVCTFRGCHSCETFTTLLRGYLLSNSLSLSWTPVCVWVCVIRIRS